MLALAADKNHPVCSHHHADGEFVVRIFQFGEFSSAHNMFVTNTLNHNN